MDIDYHNGLVMDFQNLISCIQCHEDSTNLPIIIETLNTIVDICTNEECGKDAFREAGGLDFLMELVLTTDSTVLLEHVLKTLAVVIVENVHNQMLMSKREYFLHFHTIIKRSSFPSAILKNTLLLLSSILFQNRLAQNLIAEEEFLQDLLLIYENASPSIISHSYIKSAFCDSSVDLFLNVNSVLCFAVNNPQNEKNQDVCSVLFPLTLKLLESSSDVLISGAVSSFLSLCVADNRNMQQKFADNDGLLVLKRSFQKLFDAVESDLEEFNNIVSKCILQSLNDLIGVITAVVCENGENAAFLGRFGVITLMIKLLLIGLPDDQLQIRIMLALAYGIDAHANCKSYILQTDNFDVFLKNNFQKENQEVVSASKYLLQICLNKEDDSFERYLGKQNSFPLVDNRCNFPTHVVRNQSSQSIRNVRAEPLPIANNLKFSSHTTPRRAHKLNNIDSKSKDNFFPKIMKKDKNPRSKSSILSGKLQCSGDDTAMMQKRVMDFINDSKKYWGQKKQYQLDSVKKYKNSKSENFLLLNDVQPHLCDSFHESHSKKSYCPASEVSYFSANHLTSSQKKFHSKCVNNKSDMSSIKHLSAKNLSIGIRKIEKENMFNTKQELTSVLSKDSHLYKNGKKSHRSLKTSTMKKKFNLCKNSVTHNEVKQNTLDRSINVVDTMSQISNNTTSHDDNFSSIKNKCLRYLSNERKTHVEKSEDEVCAESFGNIKQTLNSSESQRSFDFNPSMKAKKGQPNENFCCNRNKSTKRKYWGEASLESKLNSSEKSAVSNDEFESYMQVLIFPGETCEQHKLISSFEMLKIIPAKEENNEI